MNILKTEVLRKYPDVFKKELGPEECIRCDPVRLTFNKKKIKSYNAMTYDVLRFLKLKPQVEKSYTLRRLLMLIKPYFHQLQTGPRFSPTQWKINSQN